MAQKIGLLGVSMAALGLAVTGYFVQGASAVTAPIEVADFAVSPAALASNSGGDEYDSLAGETDLLHPTATSAPQPCQDGAGLATLKLNAEVGVVCLEGKILGYIVTVEGQKPKLVSSLGAAISDKPDQACPASHNEDQPDA